MPARRDPGAKAETRLARVRLARGVTQEELADAIGISLPTYRRLELRRRDRKDNPGIRYLVNAALALGVNVTDLLEADWGGWTTFDESRAAPPKPDEFWRRPYTPDPEFDELMRRRGSEQ